MQVECGQASKSYLFAQEAIKAGKKILLANKGDMVAAGHIIVHGREKNVMSFRWTFEAQRLPVLGNIRHKAAHRSFPNLGDFPGGSFQRKGGRELLDIKVEML